MSLLTKVHIVKAVVFSVIMYGCDSWTIKKTECVRIDAFELWCWRSLLRVPWTARRPNQSILKESTLNIHWKDSCWSFNILATWCEDLGKDPDAGKDWQQEEGAAEDEMVREYHRLNGHEFEQTLGISEGQRSLACYSPWSCKDWDTPEQLNNNWWPARSLANSFLVDTRMAVNALTV